MAESAKDPVENSGIKILPIVGIGLAIGLTIWAGIWLATPPPPPIPVEEEPEKAIFALIRDGDNPAVRKILENGVDLEAHNEMGDTPLMQTGLHGDQMMIAMFNKRGVRTNSSGLYQVTPLLRAIHDLPKLKLLIGAKARVDERAMVLAALMPGSLPTLELLKEHGGNVNAEVGGLTPLMAASYAGDYEAVRWLLREGANAKAVTEAGCTALIGATVSGNAEIVKLLLEKGADPNARYQEPHAQGDFQTPAMNAAWHGNADCLRLLIHEKADINIQGGPFNRSPLLCAATTGNVETVKLLLEKGAKKDVKDFQGRTPADWAALRGDASFTRLLGEPSGALLKNPEAGKKKIETDGTLAVSKALASALPLLQQSGHKISQTRNCVTCHQHSLVAMTVGMARRKGIAVDEEIAAKERTFVKSYLDRKAPLVMLGANIDPTLAPYALVGFQAEDQPASLLTDALVHYLVLHQQQEGHWLPESYRPPEDSSPFLFTAYAVKGMQAYASKGRAKEIRQRVERAQEWLIKATPAETVDTVFQLFGLIWSGAPANAVSKVADVLRQQQREDGGWGQLPKLPSDAYATGQAICALLESGMTPDQPAISKGIRFLLESQLEDGSWFIRSRCFPAIEYSSSGFPHGRSQFISAAGTCWACMALLHTRPDIQKQK